MHVWQNHTLSSWLGIVALAMAGHVWADTSDVTPDVPTPPSGHTAAAMADGAGVADPGAAHQSESDAVDAVRAAEPRADTVADVPPLRAVMPAEQAKAVIAQQFRQRFPGIPLGDVVETPLLGVYEVPVQGELLYSDETGRYVFQGALIDLDTRTDLTAQRLAKLSEVPFDSLPLQWAVKQVRGTGERKIAIFEDPNCGYCKQFHRTLENFDDITIYSLMFPILSPDSRTKAEHIFCAQDSVATLRGWMLEGQTPPAVSCDTPIDDLLAQGRQLNVRGTPAVFFADGSRVGGAMNHDQLTHKLATIGQAE